MEVVKWTTAYFSSHRIESARSEVEILLAHALGVRRIDLYLNFDQPLCEHELKHFKALIKRRLDSEPVAYITGTREFWSLPLAVTPSVLIPRPETECLVEAVLPFLDDPGGPPKRVLDMGTGSGAIIVALAHEHPEHQYVGMDRSVGALHIARKNARTHKLANRTDWFCGNWDRALAPERESFDLIVSNPPYIRSSDMNRLQPEIRNYEPQMALDGSADGLQCIRRIIASAHRYLKASGLVALEIADDQAQQVKTLAREAGRYEPVQIVQDYSRHDRVALMAKK